MAYASLLSDESVDSQFLVVLKPRRKVTGFGLHSGSVYSVSFDYGHVSSLEVDGSVLTEGASASLSAGEFYFDSSANILYVRTAGSADPAGHFVTATYELFIGTTDAHWYRVPTDSTTRQVYFEPLVQRSPVLKQSSTDTLFGLLPVETAQLVASNASHFFERHVYDSSFNQVEIKMYHWLDELSTGNIRLVFNGVGSSLVFQDDDVQFKLFDRLDVFNVEYRHAAGASFFGTTNFPNVDPNFNARPIRTVYGIVNGYVPVNVDFNNSAPTTSNNRQFVVMNGQSNLGSQSLTVLASPASTTTRTYVGSNHGIQVDDAVWFDKASDEYKLVTAVGANYIEHSALSGACSGGDLVKRSFVGNLTVVQGQNKYRLLFGRDYSEKTDYAGTASGFLLANNFEASHSGMVTFSPNDKVYCRVYGKKNTTTLGGSAFGANDSSIGVLSQAIVILFQLMKDAGLTESEIDTATFTTLQGTLTDTIGLAIPERSTGAFPTYKQLLAKILQTLLLRIYLNTSSQWKVSQLGPVGAHGKTLNDEEILSDKLQYDFEYGEILSNVIVEYASREVAEDIARVGESTTTVSAESTTALYLHKVKKQKTFDSLHYSQSQAQTLANRLSYVFGDRRGVMRVETPKRFFDTTLSDVVRVSRTRMPGNAYDDETERTRDFAVVELNKSLGAVTVSIDDQKGIQDNSGSW